MEKQTIQSWIETKNLMEKDKTLKIRGMASTRSIDRHRDIVEPMAFAKSIDLFMTNPVMLLQHNMDKPIGKFTSLKMTDDGLLVEGEVLHNEDGVIDKIKSGVLQAFSIGYIPKKYEIKNEAGEVLADQDGIKKGVRFEEIFSHKNTKTISELELVEISVVSIPANARSLFGVSESVTKFFDNLQKDWLAEIKTIENPAENIAENADENTPTNEVLSETENGEISAENPVETEQNEVENADIPPSGDELVESDNVANEVISQIENPADETISAEDSQNEEKNSDETISENSDENISEKKFSENIENKSFEEISQKNILLSQKIEELEAKNLELKGYAVDLVTMVEEKDAEIERLKWLLKNIPVKQGLVTLGGSGKTRENSPQNNKNFMESLMYRLGAELGE